MTIDLFVETFYDNHKATVPKLKGLTVPQDTNKCYGTKKLPVSKENLRSALLIDKLPPGRTMSAWLVPTKWNSVTIEQYKAEITSIISNSDTYVGVVDSPIIFVNKRFFGSWFARPTFVEVYLRPNPLPPAPEVISEEEGTTPERLPAA